MHKTSLRIRHTPRWSDCIRTGTASSGSAPSRDDRLTVRGARERTIDCGNPNNPNQVVAAFQPAGIAYSTDGGLTFGLADLPAIEGWRGGGDVSVAFDNKGNVYLATLHFDKLGSASYWGHGAGRNGIFVRRSQDGGKRGTKMLHQ